MKQQPVTILFADIVGSTRLFDRLGDAAAAKLVASCLDQLATITLEQQGKIVKTIGDAIMCSFELPHEALKAATEMHEQCRAMRLTDGSHMALRIGAHIGQVLELENDIVGDVVNIASRLTNLAGAQKILITQDLLEHIPEKDRPHNRPFDKRALKGKLDETEIVEILWEVSDVTITSTAISLSDEKAPKLQLDYQEQQASIMPGPSSVWLGRHPSCGLVIATSMTSRFHAKIEHHRGKFVLTDESTNGTYIHIDGREFYLRRESFPLIGQGLISLGEKPDITTPIKFIIA